MDRAPNAKSMFQMENPGDRERTMNEKKICSLLFGEGIDSETRIWPLLQLLDRADDDETFWRIFRIGWPNCDNTWAFRRDLMMVLNERVSAGPFLTGKDKKFYEGLPDRFRIFRGCSAERVRGFSWTTNLYVAMDFAGGHRGIQVKDAVIATAMLSKEAIFTVSTERQENEVVINWRHLRQLSVHAVG